MITIDVTGRSPIYEQICHGICAEISRGVYKENDRIPAARALAKELGLNPNTVAKAYGMLERDEGLDSMSQDGSKGYRCPRCGYVTFFNFPDRP